MLSRRNFLTCCSLATLNLLGRFGRFGLMNAFAQDLSDYRALVCVFLFGGNDGNNLIVPLSQPEYDAYAKARGDLALPASSLVPITTPGNTAYGLHPNLDTLAPLFNAGNLAILVNVGTLVVPISRTQYENHSASVPVNLFSHSDQQLQWQTSITSGFGNTGWGGRAADAILQSGLNGSSAFPTFLSLSGNAMLGIGNQTTPAIFTTAGPIGLNGFNSGTAAQARLLAFQQMLTFESGLSLIQAANSTVSNGLVDASTLAKAITGAPALKTVFPKTSLAAQLAEVAKIIQVRDALGIHRQLFFCSLGGFDTHSNQLSDQAALFTQLGGALTAFFDAAQELGVFEFVTTFTESDFGRTFQPNSNRGTDHAWGNHHLILGGQVAGGNIYGTFPQLVLSGPDDVDTRGRWIPTTSVDQYGATLASWFGVENSDLTSVFPNLLNFAQPNLGFLKTP
jgi:uncharacterized protein (DUF1501 family)